MRTTALRIACLGLIVAGSGLIVASAKATGNHPGQNQSCSVATLKGYYVFSAVGVSNTTTDEKIAVAGYEIYNGDGTFTGRVTVNEGGQVITPPGGLFISGTYTVNPDCSGTEKIDTTGQKFDLYIMPSGAQFRWVETDPNTALAGDEVRSDGRGSGG